MSETGRMERRLGDRIRNLFARGVVKMVNAAYKMQAVQVAALDGELLDNVEHPENYGFTSRAHPGAEAFLGFVGGARSHGIALVVADRRFRVTELETGEVCIYTDEEDYIHFKRGNVIEVKTKTFRVNAEVVDLTAATSATVTAPLTVINASTQTRINTPNLSMGGEGGGSSATLNGSLTATDDLLSNNGAVSLNGHVHSGVQPGASNTGQPVGGS